VASLVCRHYLDCLPHGVPVSGTLVISNLGVGDESYTNDFGTWNVTRAQRDFAKHKVYSIDFEEAYKANANVEVEAAKVKRYMTRPDILEVPLIGAIEGGVIWIIDGHHRLRALHRLGVKECAAYVIEEADAAPYKVWYNGERLPPFKVT
jgi:hypothetical protein